LYVLILIGGRTPALDFAEEARMKESPDELLPTRGLVERWPRIFRSEQTVRRYRMLGTGPRFTVISNRAYYYANDVEAWINARPFFASTAERKVAAEAA
jgi:hypothetical protein